MKKDLESLNTEIEETRKFILILDEGRDKILHTVSPFSPEDADEKKIQELKGKLHMLEDKKQSLWAELQSLSNLLMEYDQCIDDAFDLELCKENSKFLTGEEFKTETDGGYKWNLLSELDREKSNTAKELFDSFSPLFTVATYRLDIAQKYMDIDPVRSKKEIIDVSGTVENCISEMNRIISMISPIAFQNKSLKEALDQEFERMKESFGVRIHFEYQVDTEPSSKVVCSSIYQMIQEVCSCMVMYEEPDEIRVAVRCDERKKQKQIKIDFSDCCKKENNSPKADDSLGDWYREKLCLVKEKTYLLSGKLDVNSSVPGQTDICITIPYEVEVH
ncbi:MAG: hypothetical protein ACI39H_09825 [Lachnospiraceae bacterium]